LPQPSHPDLVVGTETGDDAAVWRRPDGRVLISTADFFTPLVDDARTWGAIAAANAASDIYAMGGRPLFALNLVAWPRDLLPLDLLGDVLEGASAIAEAGGWMAVGGHTVDGSEPLFGQSVTGEAAEAELLTNATGQEGDALVLTKALGTGVVATAHKRLPAAAVAPGGRLEPAYHAAVSSMTRLNAAAAAAARRVGARCATDVTGFGLLGHLHKLALASGVSAELDTAACPLLHDAAALAAEGFVPGGTARNLDYVAGHLGGLGERPPATSLELLADPQTSGGLLIACPPTAAAEVVSELAGGGHPAAIVGTLTSGIPGHIALR
jgi:selenide,water dikinase